MSDSYECDRCGTYYDEKNRIERHPIGFSDVWDLCEGCQQDFEMFMQGDETGLSMNSDPYNLLDSLDEWMAPRYLTEIRAEDDSDIAELHFSKGKEPNELDYSRIQALRDTLSGVYGPPRKQVDLPRPSRNVFGDADRAEDALDEQVEGGYKNY